MALVLAMHCDSKPYLGLMYDAVELAVHLPKGGVTMEVDPLIAEVHSFVDIQLDVLDAGICWKEACLARCDTVQILLNEWL